MMRSGHVTAPDRTRFRLLFALLLLLPLSALAETLSSLPAPVARILDAHGIPHETLSVWVHEHGADGPLLAHRATTPRNPASTIKLLTTWVALQELGPAWRWHTDALLDGALVEGTLDGDLYLRGGGDPYLVIERMWMLVRELRMRGLREVRGDLVIDNSHFSLPDTDPGAFDGQAFRSYNVQPDALLVNFQTVNFTFVPEPGNGRVRIIADPQPANLDVRNRMEVAGPGCRVRAEGIRMLVSGADSPGRVTFAGQLGGGCREQRLNRASLMPAPDFAYGVFRALWEESGGTLAGGMRIGIVPEEARQFVRFTSPSLGELARLVNKYSNNVMTEHLFLTLGAERYGAPATPEKARDAVRMVLEEHGLQLPDLYLDNGSGLSRDTRISAQSLGRLLERAREERFAPEFTASMSLAGYDGTLRRRFNEEHLRGRMHLKTGRLDGTLAIAGYVQTLSGRRFTVVSLHEHPDAHRGPGEEAQDALLRWIGRQ